MFTKLMILTGSLILFMSSAAYADLAIIGHPDTDTGELNAQKVRNLFLGERDAFPSGIHAMPINHVKGSPDRKEFFSSVLSLSESGYRRLWKRKVSVNEGNSPEEVSSYSELLRTVANTPGSIGYINAKNVDGTVKVLFTVSSY
jgi:ABC-type phosphate transport system substrate-binding protein